AARHFRSPDPTGYPHITVTIAPSLSDNVTFKSCRDILFVEPNDRCTLSELIDGCANDDGLIDYVAFFFCAFDPEKLPLALLVSVLWLLILFIATGVTATDFLCPALFMISKTLGLSQNIAGVTFLAFGNTSADIFAAINGIRLGSGTLITTAIAGSVFALKEFRLDKVTFLRDICFYIVAVSLLFYAFIVPGKIRLIDSIMFLGLYAIYVGVVIGSRYFTKDKPLKSMHGAPDKEEDGGIEFEGVHIDDDPMAGMVVMRGFLFLPEDAPQLKPIFKIDKIDESTFVNGNSNTATMMNTNVTNKSSRRVTLFEDNLFTERSSGTHLETGDAIGKPRTSRSASLLSVSKQQLINLRRASRDIRRQSMVFLSGVSPIDLDLWRQQNWGGRSMELVKAPIRLFLLLTTPMADVEGKHEWNKPLSTLHCITGPIFVVFAFGFGLTSIRSVPIALIVFIITTPIALTIICTSTSETPPFYYNAYSSYLGFIVAITWIYTISNEVINLLRAIGIAFNLSNEIMGLTVLAWGNCMLDFITNVSIARKGFPRMAIAACYGGPLMSTLVGIGLPSFLALLFDPNHETSLGASPLLAIIYSFLLFALITTLIIVIALKFRVKKHVGYYLIGLYILLILTEWLTEFHVFALFY
ncbi:putative sodium/calcium exchanger 7, partial [Fragariocoptes setiger]